jgi:hypothetical protein
MPVHSALERIRAEFSEMPGLRLTADQVQRLCGVDWETCHAVLDALVGAKVLRVDMHGRYALQTTGEISVKRAERRDRAG